MPGISTALEKVGSLGAQPISGGPEVALVNSLDTGLSFAGGGGGGGGGGGIYLEDDWGDDSLTSRSNASDGVFTHPTANEAGDVLIGRYRPEWTGNASATNNRLEFPGDGATSYVETPTSLQTGSWKFDGAHLTENGGGDNIHFHPLYAGSNNNYDRLFGDSNHSTLNFRQLKAGTNTLIISATWNVDTNVHTEELTRDSYGNWESIHDGTSKGTATASWTPNISKSNLRITDRTGGTDDDTKMVDNLEVK